MPTILELFENKELNFPGGSTADGLVDSSAEENRGGFKQQVKNFAQQELTGIRVKSLVEVNNPLIYGNQATRIAQRTTPDKDDMLSNIGTPESAGGLNLNKVIGKARDAVNGALGIPETLLPSRVVELKKDPKKGSIDFSKNPTNEAITRESYGKNGTGLGALLKSSGGNPSTLGKQAVGGAIGAVKKGLRGAIFGKPGELPSAAGNVPVREEYFGINDSDKSGTYSEKHKEKKDGDFKTRMGIEGESKVDHKLNPPSFNVPEGQDDKTQVPFWIQGVTDDESDRMYFRVAISGLSETVTPTWTGNKFIGNPHSYYIYEGVERAVTFNMNIYCMNQTELLESWDKLKYLTSKVYPTYGEQDVINAPFIKFQLGDMYVERNAFIESLTYTVPDTGTWEIDTVGIRLPKFIDVSMTIKLLETPGVEERLYDYRGKVKTTNAGIQPAGIQPLSTSPITAPSIPSGFGL